MFIKKLVIKNFRLFGSQFILDAGEINIPDGTSPGSGLTVLVGENGTGKTSILEALAIPLIGYKADSIALIDFYDIKQKTELTISSSEEFDVKKSTPRGEFKATGFYFKANVRQQDQTRYLSSTIVSDTRFIPSSSTPVNDTSPDLRVSVNNPFSGPRFNENDYLYIDKNRTKQLESGTFSSTRFDRLLGDFNFQYLKTNLSSLLDPNNAVNDTLSASSINNEFLDKAFEDFKRLTDYDVELSFIDNQAPYSKGYLTYAAGETKQLPVEKLGSGYQMFLAILCQYRLSLQSGKKLIIFIDEVELHLHYKLQVSLAKLLLEISKTAQVIVTTHSAQLLKDLRPNDSHLINVLKKSGAPIDINPVEDYVLPFPSVNESSFVAFEIPSIEYFNELYGYLQDLKGRTSINEFDAEISTGETMYDWERVGGGTDNLSVHSCIRHKIHHPDNTLNDGKFNFDEALPISIKFLRVKIQEHTT